MEAEGVEFKVSANIGHNVPIEDLRKNNHDPGGTRLPGLFGSEICGVGQGDRYTALTVGHTGGRWNRPELQRLLDHLRT